MASNHPGPLDITYSAHELRQGEPHPTPAERQREAARAMLATLKRIAGHESRADRRHRGMVDVSEVRDLQRMANSAIALAESAGIKAEG